MLSKRHYPHFNRATRRHPKEHLADAGRWINTGNWLLAGLMMRAGLVASNVDGAVV